MGLKKQDIEKETQWGKKEDEQIKNVYVESYKKENIEFTSESFFEQFDIKFGENDIIFDEDEMSVDEDGEVVYKGEDDDNYDVEIIVEREEYKQQLIDVTMGIRFDTYERRKKEITKIKRDIHVAMKNIYLCKPISFYFYKLYTKQKIYTAENCFNNIYTLFKTYRVEQQVKQKMLQLFLLYRFFYDVDINNYYLPRNNSDYIITVEENEFKFHKTLFLKNDEENRDIIEQKGIKPKFKDNSIIILGKEVNLTVLKLEIEYDFDEYNSMFREITIKKRNKQKTLKEINDFLKNW